MKSKLFKSVPFLFLFFSVCCVNNKEVLRYNNLLTKQIALEKQIIELSNKIIEKVNQEVVRGELSPQNAERIVQNLNEEIDKIHEQQNDYAELKNELLESRSKGKHIKEIEKVVSLNNAAVISYAEKLKVLEDAFELENLKTYETAAFFPPGEYKIPQEFVKKVNITFSKVFDEILDFSQLHNGIKTTAIINTVGYADEQGFIPNSDFAKEAQQKLAVNQLSRQQLNQLLSTYRAETLANSIKQTLSEKIISLQSKNIEQVQINTEGKGEEFPNPLITDYKKNDERRRIVVVYWNVIPSEFLTDRK